MDSKKEKALIIIACVIGGILVTIGLILFAVAIYNRQKSIVTNFADNVSEITKKFSDDEDEETNKTIEENFDDSNVTCPKEYNIISEDYYKSGNYYELFLNNPHSDDSCSTVYIKINDYKKLRIDFNYFSEDGYTLLEVYLNNNLINSETFKNKNLYAQVTIQYIISNGLIFITGHRAEQCSQFDTIIINSNGEPLKEFSQLNDIYIVNNNIFLVEELLFPCYQNGYPYYNGSKYTSYAMELDENNNYNIIEKTTFNVN